MAAVQIHKLLSVNTSGCELWDVLVHVHAHQPMTDLLIGPFGQGSALPQVALSCWWRVIIYSL